jgi:cell division protein FtsI/penicillin-binding protein 2
MSLGSRACVATYGLAALLTGLSARLYYIAVHEHEYYKDIARRNYEAREFIPARRGSILAANGTVLARNEPLKDVIVDDSLISQWDEKKKAKRPKHEAREAAVKILATALKKTPAEILALIKPDSKFAIIERKISEETATDILAQFEAAKIKGLRFEQDFDRVYPAGNLLCHVLGFYGWAPQIDPITKKDNGSRKGASGIELAMENWLAGQPGWRYYEKDGHNRELPPARR